MNNYFSLPDTYDIDYGHKVINHFENFKKKVLHKDGSNPVYLAAFYRASKSQLTFSNAALNTKDTAISYISVSMVLDFNFFESEFFTEIIQLALDFGFDYGYGRFLKDNYEFDTEKKRKILLFGRSSTITADDINYNKSIPEFKNGYIRSLYPYNIINNKQKESPLITDALWSGDYNIIALNDAISLVKSKNKPSLKNR